MSDLAEALVKEANELPDPQRNLLTHNERELIEFCFRLRDAIVVMRAENDKLRAALKHAADLAHDAYLDIGREEYKAGELAFKAALGKSDD